MTWNIFRLFGIFIMALVIYAAISKVAGGAAKPVLHTGERFMNAINSSDLATVRELSDPKSCMLLEAGGRLASMAFSEVSVFHGSFSKQPAVKWSYSQLIALKISDEEQPHVDSKGGLAMIPFADGAKMYLHKIDGQWKVFYIAQPAVPSV